MGSPFVHVELMSSDVGKAQAFYGNCPTGTSRTWTWGGMTYEGEHQEQRRRWT
jgi:hypothetical protein